jgi:predicted nuclease of predicted toxin-antitoxin system
VKLVIDANLSPAVVVALKDAGYDASHVGDHGLLAAKDEEIFEWAERFDAVIVTADSDFAMLLAIRRASKPSVVHIRDVADRQPLVHAGLLIENLGSIVEALEAGAIVSLSPTHLRVRDLPIR